MLDVVNDQRNVFYRLLIPCATSQFMMEFFVVRAISENISIVESLARDSINSLICSII